MLVWLSLATAKDGRADAPRRRTQRRFAPMRAGPFGRTGDLERWSVAIRLMLDYSPVALRSIGRRRFEQTFAFRPQGQSARQLSG